MGRLINGINGPINRSARNAVPVEKNINRRKQKTNNDYLDEELFRRIAGKTGDEYFRARDKLSLENIYQQIDKMEKSKIEVQSPGHYREAFIPLLVIALGLLFIELVLRFTFFGKFP